VDWSPLSFRVQTFSREHAVEYRPARGDQSTRERLLSSRHVT